MPPTARGSRVNKGVVVIRRFAAVLTIVPLLLALGGCWNYRGLNEFETVMGMAIDRMQSPPGYAVVFECIDLSQTGSKSGKVSRKLLSSEGETVFDAIRKAKNSLGNRLFFSQAQVIVMSQAVAEEGVAPIVEWLLREQEIRETLYVVISREKTAKRLLEAEPVSQNFTAMEMSGIIEKDYKVSAYTRKVPLYQAYNMLEEDGVALTLPAFGLRESGDKQMVQSDGTAVFRGDRLCGFVTQEQTWALLFVENEVGGGVLTADYDGDGQSDVSMEIRGSSAKKSVAAEGDSVRLTIAVRVDVHVTELPSDVSAVQKDAIERIQELTREKLEKSISSAVAAVQSQYAADVLGVGRMIYQTDPPLWRRIGNRWDELFRTMEVRVTVKVTVRNSGMEK